jgi:hypothetical protein
MSRTNGAGQPSVDEILASIRASIAEEDQPRTAPVRSDKFKVQQADAVNGESHEFDLPNIFKPSLQSAPEKHTKLFGRLADALLGANAEGTSEIGSSRRIDLDAPPINEPIVTPAAAAPAPVAQPSTSAPAPAAAAPSTPAENVQRVMAPFRDTRMSRLGGAAPTPSAPVTPAPIAASPAPSPVSPAPVAPVVAPDPLAKGQWARPEPEKAAPVQPPSSDWNRGNDFGTFAPERPAQGMNGSAHGAFNGHHHETPAMNGGAPEWQRPAYNPPAPPPAPPQLARPPVATPPEVRPEPPRGGVEDAAAQLLRPMLRQWLSENMPKIVESALRSEAADSVRPGGPGKPPSHD